MQRIRPSLVALILIGLLSILRPCYNQSAPICEPLGYALNAAGVRVQEVSINGWTHLSGQNLSTGRLRALVTETMAQLGFAGASYTVFEDTNQYQRLARAEFRGDSLQVVVVAQVLYPRFAGRGPESYLVVNVDTRVDQDTVRNWQDKIAALLSRAGGRPRINTCLVGWLDGKLREDEWADKLEAAFRAIDATVIDKTAYTNFASFTGYSPLIRDWLRIGDKRININMAMRYSPYDNRTFVTIGSPVITREY